MNHLLLCFFSVWDNNCSRTSFVQLVSVLGALCDRRNIVIFSPAAAINLRFENFSLVYGAAWTLHRTYVLIFVEQYWIISDHHTYRRREEIVIIWDTNMFVMFDLRIFCYLVYCGGCRQRSNSWSDCHGFPWLETVISSSSWYCNCNAKSFCMFLLFVKNLFLDIKGCNVMYVAAVVIE
jgi:hypothetical protein